MKPAKLDTTTTSSLERLSAGFFWILVSGTLAAKVLLLVDNDLEITAKFSDKNLQINIQPIRKYAILINNFVDRQFSPISTLIQQQSSQLIRQAGNILATRKDWCLPVSRLPTISIKSKRSQPIFLDNHTPDRLVIIPDEQQLSSATTPLRPTPTASSQPAKDWCVTTGTKP
ncbi:hypothetical protein [Chamaesiphon sp.]|uniref:hypothetical protein n=1 Tax=Chamaesiphon sp. TaxID=2814140 RepID=UPI00359381ED